MSSPTRIATIVLGAWLALLLLHYPLLGLPYFWDEAGYYALAAFDFYRRGLLIPESTWALGHTPLASVYLGTAWRLAGVSPCVARTAMLLIAAGTVVTTYRLARSILPTAEIAVWSAVLLALSPLFFAQSMMLQIDLPAALFVTLAMLSLLRQRLMWFAVTSSLAFLSKETSIIILPVAWAFSAWMKASVSPEGTGANAEIIGKSRPEMPGYADSSEFKAAHQEHRTVLANLILPLKDSTWIFSPVLVAVAWALYYHHHTGFWTGNREYLQYNLYSNLNPVRFLLTLIRRLYQVLVGGFDWVLVGAALVGIRRSRDSQSTTDAIADRRWRASSSAAYDHFLLLAGAVCTVYILFHSIIGGAILRRYLLPVYPAFFIIVVGCVWKLPRKIARAACGTAAVLFVAAWFLNGFNSFEFESNLAFSDFVQLHQQAAQYLESRPGYPRILTAWPASGELLQPLLGYVHRPLRVVAINDFDAADFERVSGGSFDLLYFYSRKSEAVRPGIMQFRFVQRLNQRYFDYRPPVADDTLIRRYHLKLDRQFERRGQWVRIYARQE